MMRRAACGEGKVQNNHLHTPLPSFADKRTGLASVENLESLSLFGCAHPELSISPQRACEPDVPPVMFAW